MNTKELYVDEIVNSKLKEFLENHLTKRVSQVIGELCSYKTRLESDNDFLELDKGSQDHILNMIDDSVEMFSSYPGELLCGDIGIEDLRGKIKVIVTKYYL